MKYIFDTREQKNEHIKKYFKKHNILFEIKKLDVGDYQKANNSKVSVDRKQNLDELATNLLTNDKSRFWREIRRAYNEHIRLIVVCEHSKDVTSLLDVASWVSKHSRFTGRQLMDKIYEVRVSYDVEFVFCSKDETAQKIIELLGE